MRTFPATSTITSVAEVGAGAAGASPDGVTSPVGAYAAGNGSPASSASTHQQVIPRPTACQHGHQRHVARPQGHPPRNPETSSQGPPRRAA
ncbi:hypothetical protein [Nocardioides alcanivorans]|uniref:hypothetical protein n=1 Tax=Nocardioides alcanivorans TaxID=2897352 RepID=UPI001F2695BF|nr:hypothetical protein [Nocardioides alcanivorans]